MRNKIEHILILKNQTQIQLTIHTKFEVRMIHLDRCGRKMNLLSQKNLKLIREKSFNGGNSKLLRENHSR